jgi:hypothetical protein
VPNYSTLAPPQSLYPGDVFYSFGSIDSPNQLEKGEPIPAAPQAGQRCATSQSAAAAESDSDGRAITYEVEFDSAPSAGSVSLQGAIRDVDSEYFTLDTITPLTLAKHQKTFFGVRELFLRLRLDAITPNAATTIVGKILG